MSRLQLELGRNARGGAREEGGSQSSGPPEPDPIPANVPGRVSRITVTRERRETMEKILLIVSARGPSVYNYAIRPSDSVASSASI